jgi:hypothetical protein
MRYKFNFFSLISFIITNHSYTYADSSDFSVSIEPLSETYKTEFIKNKYWNEDCPVKLTDLSDLKMTYWGGDDQPHQGELIIHKQLALEVVNIFKELFEIKFPIYEMKPYQLYPRGEYAQHNDTVGYYCSVAQDKITEYSSHAYGTAIDINPLINPFLDSKEGWWPKGSDRFANRSQNIKGMIHLEDTIFQIFTKYGWTWGGLQKGSVQQKNIDYMHFSKGMESGYVVTSLIYLPEGKRIREELKKVSK